MNANNVAQCVRAMYISYYFIATYSVSVVYIGNSGSCVGAVTEVSGLYCP